MSQKCAAMTVTVDEDALQKGQIMCDFVAFMMSVTQETQTVCMQVSKLVHMPPVLLAHIPHSRLTSSVRGCLALTLSSSSSSSSSVWDRLALCSAMAGLVVSHKCGCCCCTGGDGRDLCH